MYYLRTKSAVDAIKFTLSKEVKKSEEVETEVPKAAKVQAATIGVSLPEKSLTAQELREMLAQGKDAAENDEDCLMCGS